MKLLIDECLPRALNHSSPGTGVELGKNLAGRGIAVLILGAQSNRIEDLTPLIPAALPALRSIHPGRATWVGEAGER
jgi:hypothetical protein